MSKSTLIGVAEAAKILDEARSTTFRRVQSGELPAQRVGDGELPRYVLERANVEELAAKLRAARDEAKRERIADLQRKLDRAQGAVTA